MNSYQATLLSVSLLALTYVNADDNRAPAEIQVGERLHRDIRFSHYFAANSGGDVNAKLHYGDPSQDFADSTQGPVNGFFAGLATNCRACHPATEYLGTRGIRGYADMARRSQIEHREDGLRHTVRNSQAFIDIGADPSAKPLFHFDGEFTSLRELVVETMAGRNYGWLTSEREVALKHIVRVIREDDGSSKNQTDDGGSYSDLLRGGDDITPRLQLPERYRIDVRKASDGQILDRIGELVEVYMLSLRFSRDEESGLFNGSPYDAFLEANDLPRAPAENETPRAYARRLLAATRALKSPKFIDDAERTMMTFMKSKPFRFGPEELAGMLVFLSEPDRKKPPVTGVANCVACHTPPSFTDFNFHNTGVTQAEYDAVHGVHAFSRLPIPTLAERNAAPEKFLPPSRAFPKGDGPFFAITEKHRPGRTDLGLWNVFANPAVPAPQESLRTLLLRDRPDVPDETLLSESVGLFRTPTLRLLGQSDPYMHNGMQPSLTAVVAFYATMFEKADRGEIRNVSPEFMGLRLSLQDRTALVAYLESLNEDYE